MTAETSIYVTITANSHAEFVAKLGELYKGFCQPQSFGAVLAGEVLRGTAFSTPPVATVPVTDGTWGCGGGSGGGGGACDGPGVDPDEPDTHADLPLTMARVGNSSAGPSLSGEMVQEGPKAAKRRGRPRKSETQEAAALAPPPEESAAADEPGALEAAAHAPVSPLSGAAAGAAIPDLLNRAKDQNEAKQEKATKEDVRAALNDYVGKTNLEQGRALLQKVCGADVLSMSQIPEAKYAEVVAACRAPEAA